MDERTTVNQTETGKAFLPPASVSQRSPEEIRADIERTRVEMSETMEAIRERLSPDRLKEQMREKIRDVTIGRAKRMASIAGGKTKAMGSTVIDTIKSNPVPVAMVGIGLGWLILGKSDGSDTTRSYPRQRRSGDVSLAGTEASAMMGTAKGKAKEMTAQIHEKTGQIKGQVEEKAGEVREKASQLSIQAQEKAARISGAARERVHQAQSYFQQMIHDNPLAVGAALLAIGAAVGLSVPESRREREFMGETSEGVITKAKEAAYETAEKVKQAAETTIQRSTDETYKQESGPAI